MVPQPLTWRCPPPPLPPPYKHLSPAGGCCPLDWQRPREAVAPSRRPAGTLLYRVAATARRIIPPLRVVKFLPRDLTGQGGVLGAEAGEHRVVLRKRPCEDLRQVLISGLPLRHDANYQRQVASAFESSVEFRT